MDWLLQRVVGRGGFARSDWLLAHCVYGLIGLTQQAGETRCLDGVICLIYWSRVIVKMVFFNDFDGLVILFLAEAIRFLVSWFFYINKLSIIAVRQLIPVLKMQNRLVRCVPNNQAERPPSLVGYGVVSILHKTPIKTKCLVSRKIQKTTHFST
jgi:hypothetical protein